MSIHQYGKHRRVHKSVKQIIKNTRPVCTYMHVRMFALYTCASVVDVRREGYCMYACIYTCIYTIYNNTYY